MELSPLHSHLAAASAHPVAIAWDLIGHEGQFRILGGRMVYDAVMYNTARSSCERVRLARLDTSNGDLHQVNRWVDADTPVEVLRDYTAEAESERQAAWL